MASFSNLPKLKVVIPLLMISSILLYACIGNRTITILPAPTYNAPYISVTPTQTPTITTSPIPENSFVISTPTPSPTPFMYTVQKDDTFSSIAYRHGVRLKELISANPNIDPNFLSIGISITIPITGSNSTIYLNPTPIPLKLQSPNCFRTSDGDIWCLALVENTQPFDVENVSGQFLLISTNADESLSQTGSAPLNLLQAGKSIPITTYFPAPNPKDFQARVELNTVLPIQPDSERYIQTKLEDKVISIMDSGLQARVSGNLTISGEDVAELIWIVAFAYDKDGALIGFRKWESLDPLTEKETLSFEINLYSLGPPIDQVEILSEARP